MKANMKFLLTTLAATLSINLTGCESNKLSIRDADQYKYVSLSGEETMKSELEGVKDTTEYLKEAFVANNAFGALEKSAKPLVRPAEYLQAWVPPHRDPDDPAIMIAGHYIVIRVKDEHYLVEEIGDNTFTAVGENKDARFGDLPKETR
jgi:hypothetical protein